MKFFRRVRLLIVPAGICALSLTGWGQAPPPQQTPAPAPQQTPQTPPPGQPPARPNPFESVPQQPTQQPPVLTPPPPVAAPKPPAGQPQIEAPKPAAPTAPVSGEVIEDIEFRGARRVPQDTLRAMIETKRGDLVNEDALRRDFMRLWNMARFDDIRLETEQGKAGGILRFVLTERRMIRSMNCAGIHSVPVSE